MANSKFDSKSFNAEAFKYMVDRVPNLNLNELKKSRALAGNPDIRGVFTAQNGTAYARLAMRGLIGRRRRELRRPDRHHRNLH